MFAKQTTIGSRENGFQRGQGRLDGRSNVENEGFGRHDRETRAGWFRSNSHPFQSRPPLPLPPVRQLATRPSLSSDSSSHASGLIKIIKLGLFSLFSFPIFTFTRVFTLSQMLLKSLISFYKTYFLDWLLRAQNFNCRLRISNFNW